VFKLIAFGFGNEQIYEVSSTVQSVVIAMAVLTSLIIAAIAAYLWRHQMTARVRASSKFFVFEILVRWLLWCLSCYSSALLLQFFMFAMAVSSVLYAIVPADGAGWVRLSPSAAFVQCAISDLFLFVHRSASDGLGARV
jgi:hypothetical protein